PPPVCRSWCFTVNNYTYTPTALPPHGKYAVIGREVGAEGTPHLQGYIEYDCTQRPSAVYRWLQAKCYATPRRGSSVQARTYCMKEDPSPLEFGTFVPPAPGRRSDIDALYDSATSGQSLAQVASEHRGTYLRYYRAVQHVQALPALEAPPLRTSLHVSVFEGPPGSGKTATAYALYPNLYAVPLGKDIWFDGYTGQDVLLFDDFSGQMRLVDLLRFTDIYPVQVPIKGGFVYLQCTKIIFTTNVPLAHWYNFSARQDSLDALSRRVHETRFFTLPFDIASLFPPLDPLLDLGGPSGYVETPPGSPSTDYADLTVSYSSSEEDEVLYNANTEEEEVSEGEEDFPSMLSCDEASLSEDESSEGY
uniref:hypothetical protein n=1 Tax=Roseivirga sp. TaxID=1964215 RepID=UPI004048114D